MSKIPEWARKLGITEVPEGMTLNDDGTVTTVKRMSTEDVKRVYGVEFPIRGDEQE